MAIQPNANEGKKSNDETTQIYKYIMPPGLQPSFYEFLAHFKVAENQAIMIVGETGVGKSVFLHIYRKLYEHLCSTNGRKPDIIWANCSHFGSRQSDPNIARAELFGFMKGAFQGAVKDTDGLIKKAENSALILEEIGELPKPVQAMLLTFIETGEYRPVGSTETKFADVRIVGATNNEDALRPDFRYRFFPFYIPPLYKRRWDVLYYICAQFPQLINSLKSNETLALLAYNWPGNVREIDRVSRLMLRHNHLMEYMEFKTDKERLAYEQEKLYMQDERYSFFQSQKTQGILNGVSTWDGDTELLESLLNSYFVGLSRWKSFNSFPAIYDCLERLGDSKPVKFEGSMVDPQVRFGVKFVPEIWEFENAYIGFLKFCGLFGQDPDKKENILADIENAEEQQFTTLVTNDFPNAKRSELKKLVKAIMHSIMGIKIIDYKYPDDVFEYWEALKEQKKRYFAEKKNASVENQALDWILGMSETDLLKVYYEGLLNKTGGMIKAAAKMAGHKESTFRFRLGKMGFSSRQSQKGPK